MISQPESADTKANVTSWTTGLNGLRSLPYRVVFNGADFGRLMWWLVFVVIPVCLLSVALLIGGKTAFFYSMYSAIMMVAILQTSERFIKMTVELDQDTGDLVSTYHMGEPTLFRSDQDVATSFNDVEAARFLSLADQTMVRLYNEKSFTNKPTAFLIPSDIERHFRDSLQRHDVSIRGEPDGNATRWVWGRFVATVLLLGIIPLSAVFIWPAGSWPFLLALVVNSVFLIRQGW
ncbi:hypothetical protein ACH9L7_02360 [Haloferax sp. S1W]|uniref:hypothetical protein n=1 Tax=Haloferax sp. S1W TaxID=3377110 RepID=UPI0037C9E539